MTFQLAACAEMLWPDHPMAWRCARLRDMGFAVGLWNWPDHDIDALVATGAEFTIMNGFLEGDLYDRPEVMLASARETIKVGKRLGVARYCLLGAALPEGPKPALNDAQRLRARDTLARFCDLGAAEGVVFALENLNVLVDHRGAPLASFEEVLDLVAGLDHPNLRINLDLYHVQIGAGNLMETCRRALPWIGEIQVADVPGRNDIGTGEINFPNIARALDHMGYRGMITFEGRPLGSSEAALTAFQAAFTL